MWRYGILSIVWIIGLLLFPSPTRAQDTITITPDRDMTPYEFEQEYNICMEEVFSATGTYLQDIHANQEIVIPADVEPCYNEQGQRLKYTFDRNQWLTEYSELETYVTQPGDSLASLSEDWNICRRDILQINDSLIYVDNTINFAVGQVLFIPDAPPCYDEQGRYLISYKDGELLDEPYPAPPNTEVQIYEKWVRELSYELNICEETILEVNNVSDQFSLIYFGEILIPTDTSPCYYIYDIDSSAPEDDIYRISQELNICDDYIRRTYNTQVIADFSTREQIYVPVDSPPCHDEQGHRLMYFDYEGHLLEEPIRVDYEVYVPEPAEDAIDVAHKFNVCIEDLAAINGLRRDISSYEWLIPDTSPCYDEATGRKLIYPDDGSNPVVSDMDHETLLNGPVNFALYAYKYNVCKETLIAANPHITEYQNQSYVDIQIPNNQPPCYEAYTPELDESDYDIAHKFNVCIEDLIAANDGNYGSTAYIPLNVPPCYNEQGQRLINVDENGNLLETRVYSDLPVYIIARQQSVYDLSRKLNVCVDDLLRMNTSIRPFWSIPSPGMEIFIPDTPPCYDEETGLAILYEDDNGVPLPSPILSKTVPHTVIEDESYYSLSLAYNRCYNRIEELNIEQHPTLSPGDVVEIPINRPPCYDYTTQRYVKYVCYDQPIDMSVDNPDAVVNPDGDNCYDVQDPGTRIWHKGDQYIYQWRDFRNLSDEYIAWCFGVDLENVITRNNEIMEIAGFREVLVKNPTRTCYLHEDDGADVVHVVKYGDTLRDIGMRYGKLPSSIAEANNIADPNLIWIGQRLVIPPGPNLWHVMLGMGLFLPLGSGSVFFWRRRRRHQKRKRKPTYADV